jgi:hypothetical protein
MREIFAPGVMSAPVIVAERADIVALAGTASLCAHHRVTAFFDFRADFAACFG